MNHRVILITYLLGILLVSIACSQPLAETSITDYWPDKTWRKSSPEIQGINSEELVKLFDYVREKNINLNSIIIIRNGYLVLEAYIYPFERDIIHDIASVSKSITSLATGIAIDRGYIKDVNQPVFSFFKDRSVLNPDGIKNSLTIEHLLTMSSALCRNFSEGEAQTGYMRESKDGLQYMLDLPLVGKPGEKFVYSSIAPHFISAIISRTTGVNLLEFTRKNLFEPLAITNIQWPADRQGNTHGWGDLCINPLDLARIGYLVLNKGNWAGRQVVSKEWIDRSSQPHIYEDSGTAYGYLWWIPLGLPGLFEGRGRGGQRLIIWPQKNIVVVLIGNGEYTLGGIGDFLGRAIVSDEPLPENPQAQQQLEEKIVEAGTAPQPKPVAPLPALANQISGKEYILDANSLGINSFTLIFEQNHDPLIKLLVYDGMAGKLIPKEIPIGLDDVYRISNSSQYNLPAGAKGSWTSDNEFEFMYNEAANDRCFHFRIHFKDKFIELKATEDTGLFDAITIRGSMLP